MDSLNHLEALGKGRGKLPTGSPARTKGVPAHYELQQSWWAPSDSALPTPAPQLPMTAQRPGLLLWGVCTLAALDPSSGSPAARCAHLCPAAGRTRLARRPGSSRRVRTSLAPRPPRAPASPPSSVRRKARPEGVAGPVAPCPPRFSSSFSSSPHGARSPTFPLRARSPAPGGRAGRTGEGHPGVSQLLCPGPRAWEGPGAARPFSQQCPH